MLLQHLLDMLELVLVFFYDAMVQLVSSIIIKMMESSVMLVKFSWDVAKQILTDLGVTQLIDHAWNSLESETLKVMKYMRIPEALDIILSARVTRFVLAYMPFSKF